ncbi:MAG TPA: hypothetical protein VK210_00040 [Terriglobia bacterium]|nr:hypothetical protein [Terriglobia bacterium]
MRFTGKRLGLLAALAGSFLAVLSVSVPTQAQSVAMRVNIPFDFQVANRKLPAGTYTVARSGEAIQISDSNGHSAFVLSNAVPNHAVNGESQLVFNRYGDEAFLSEVRWNGYLSARELVKADSETALAKVPSTPKVLTASNAR